MLIIYYLFIILIKMKDICLLHVLIFFSILVGINSYYATIKFNKRIYHHIGRNGTLLLSFKDNDYFNSLEIIDKKVLVSDTLENENNSYKVDCGLWKEKNEPLYYFCNINETISEGKYSLHFTRDFKYKNADIHISEYGVGDLYIYNYSIIDLYYLEHQKIKITDNISEGNDKYTFRFNIVSYEEQRVFLKLTTFYPLDCKKNDDDELLYCSIDKEILNGQVSSNTDNIEFYSLYKGEFRKFYLVPKKTIDAQSEKENEYIGITKLLTPYVAFPQLYVYETNITNFPFINTKNFSLNFSFAFGRDSIYLTDCYFIKFRLTPLRMVCRRNNGFQMVLDEIKEELILDGLNYKYNLRIQPVKNEEIIRSLDEKYNSYIYWINTSHLDFRNTTSYTIDIVGNFTAIAFQKPYIIGVAFNENEEQLKCEYFENLKTCEVTLEHFNGMKNGYHYIREAVNNNTKLISYEYEPIKVTLPPLTINIQEIFINEIGQKGTIIFKTYVKEFLSLIDTRKNEIFEHEIFNKNDNAKSYNISCGFWKGEIIGNTTYVFCDLNESIPEGEYYIQFNDSMFYSYYDILLLSEKYEFKKINEEKIELYSGKQILNISDNQTNYYLSFKIFSYYDEKLFLKINSDNILDCQQNKTTNELLCSIDKYILENQISNENQKISLTYVNKKGSKNIFYLVDEIKIIINSIQKEDINILITKLLTPYAELGGNIAYDTNINTTNISYIYSPSFELAFDGADNNLSCNIIKVDENTTLKIICFADKYIEEPLSLKQIKEEKYLGELSYKYNYRIQPVENKEQFNLINSYTNKIYYLSPKFFNFTESTSYSIEIIGDFKPDIKFEWLSFNNKSSSNVKCDSIGVIKKCNLTKEHFDGVNTGYFNLYHENEQKQKFASYEISPIKVILEIFIYINEIKIGEIGKKGTWIFSAYCPKIVSSEFIDVEKKGIFDVKILNENDENNNYSIKCGLWKYNEDLYTFCICDEKIPQGNYTIKFDDIFFFDEYKIYLQSEKLKIQKLDKNIIDLYSDKQIININESKETKSDLKFKINSYNNERLFLYVNNILPLDCVTKNNELFCSFETSQIKTQVISRKTKVSVLAKDNNGKLYQIFLIPFEFNYNIEKIPIYVDLTELITKYYLWLNDYLAYDTNITDIEPLISDEFEMIFYKPRDEKFKCKFIKRENSNLNMICNISIYQNYPELYNLANNLILDNIYYKYIFIITDRAFPVGEKPLMRKEKYPKILGIIPSVLNFTEKNSILIEIFFDLSDHPENLPEVTFNESAKDLECQNLVNVKKCIVPKNHFSQNKSGYYSFMHNYINEESKYKSYEIFPLKVDFPINPNTGGNEDENKNFNNGNTTLKIVLPIVIVFGVIIIGAVVYLCIRRRRKREDGALFDSSQNEEKQILI